MAVAELRAAPPELPAMRSSVAGNTKEREDHDMKEKRIKTECICRYCKDAIYSRGEKMLVIDHHWKDEDDPDPIRCWWCDEEIEDEYYEVMI